MQNEEQIFVLHSSFRNCTTNMSAAASFQFIDPGPLRDRELHLKILRHNPADPVKRWVPSYDVGLFVDGDVDQIGRINMRAVTTPDLEKFGGHFGYTIEPAWCGHHYAERGVRLLLPLAKLHGYASIWITCNPDNWPSRRTCERLGAELVEIVPLPVDHEMYLEGDRMKCRYRLIL